MDKKAARHKRKAEAKALEAKAPKPLPRINFVPVEPPGWMKALKEKTFREHQELMAARNAPSQPEPDSDINPESSPPPSELPPPHSEPELPPPPRRDPRSYPSPEEVQAQRQAEADEAWRMVAFRQRQSAQELRNGYI